VSGIAAVIALESGWIVTEVGRQPWIVYKIMRTSAAVTHASGIWVTFGLIVGLYVALGITLVGVLRSMSRRWRSEDADDEAGPYSPATRPPDLAAGTAE
jgi:cytochrome d ubiquinol oxidase subunit I